MSATTGAKRSTQDRIDALHETASAAAGLDDFGDADYLDGLTRLVEEIADQHHDDDAAQTAASFAVLTPLTERLWSQAGWRHHPAILEAPVPQPVVIVGVPRTGTTALHKLLSMDERFQVLENWILHRPMVRPPRAGWEREPGYQAAVARAAAAPEVIRKFHLVEPHEADECLGIMSQSFVSNMFGSRQHLPVYDDWFLASDMTSSFARYANQLRLIGAEDRRPWLLKNPSHILSLEELFAVFPGAQVIQTHRPVSEALGSLVSLLTGITGEDPVPRAQREALIWGEATRRADAARIGREDRFCDVDYRSMTADPLAVAAAIYQKLGLDLDDSILGRMARWIADNPQGKHGEHHYDPSALGVTPEVVDAHFGDYIRRHGLA